VLLEGEGAGLVAPGDAVEVEDAGELPLARVGKERLISAGGHGMHHQLPVYQRLGGLRRYDPIATGYIQTDGMRA
jgi:hypothetical protein